MFKRKNSVGVTLIEFMFSLALGLLIMMSVLKMYWVMENNRRLQSGIITIQENAEMLTQLLKNKIRTSSWVGCARLTNDFPFKNHLPYSFDPKKMISEYQNDSVKKSTDGLQIWHGSLHSNFVTKKMNDRFILYVTSLLPIKENDNLLISDCKTAETFKVRQVLNVGEGIQEIISDEPIEKMYDKNSEVIKLESEAFYVGKTNRVDELNHPVYALYVKDIFGDKSELAEGVTNMQIFFSIIKNNTLVEYPIKEMDSEPDIKGIAFHLELTDSFTRLHKNWNVYAALP